MKKNKENNVTELENLKQDTESVDSGSFVSVPGIEKAYSGLVDKKDDFLVKCPNCSALTMCYFKYEVRCPSCGYKIIIDSDTRIDDNTQDIIEALFEKEMLKKAKVLVLN